MSAKCTYYGQDGHFAIKCFNPPQGESYKGKPESSTGSKKHQFNNINATEAKQFKQFKAWSEIQGRDGYNPPWATKGEKSQNRIKNRKLKFSDEVENTQSAKINKLNPPDGMPTDFFASNGQQEVYYGHLDKNSDDLKYPTVITLDSCDIKPVSF